jgi:hypothetical protein
MAQVQINPPGMLSTDEGYISSVTIRSAGAPVVQVPNATTGQITCSAQAATAIVQSYSKPMLVTG